MIQRTAAPIKVVVLCVAALAPLACRRESRTAAQQPPATTFELRDAWVRAVPDSGATTAAYLEFDNGTTGPVTISHFTSSDARVVELHRSFTDAEGEAHMTMLDSLVVPAGQTVTLKPGGYHLMLIGTTHPLVAGKLARLVMRLSDGSVVSTSARVKQ
jgi:hypothetical protein